MSRDAVERARVLDAQPAQVGSRVGPQAARARPVDAPPETASQRALPSPLVLGREAIAFEPILASATSPYRPDTVVDGGSAGGLVARVASVRGADKREDGAVRDDDFCIAYVPVARATVIAVADGMGSAERGYLGAVLASRHAVEELQMQLASLTLDELDWGKLFRRVRSALQVAYRDHAGRNEASLREVSRDLGTTLVVGVAQRVAADRMEVALASAGDSPAWRLADGGWELLVGEGEDLDADGFQTNAVVAMPYVDHPATWRGQFAQSDVLVLATDGFGKPLGNGDNDLGRAMGEYLRQPPPIASFPYLVDFERRTYGDDRTIAAIWFDSAAP